MKLIKADLHVHTSYSPDSRITPKALVKEAKKKGIGAVAITDHGTIEGALELEKMNSGLKVIVGEEVWTKDGEITGLFLKEKVPNFKSAHEAVKLIKDQGGLVMVPHPLSRMIPSRIKESVLHEIMPMVDILEVINARNTVVSDEGRVEKLAAEHGKATSAGSDAHMTLSLGRAFSIMKPFEDKEEFLENLKSANHEVVKRTSYFMSGLTTLQIFYRVHPSELLKVIFPSRFG